MKTHKHLYFNGSIRVNQVFYSIKSMIYPLVFFCFMFTNTFSQVDVLIIGGGAGGTSAGIQAARMGAKVQIIESTPWLGGMLTSAGVSAIDGNHELPSGIWGEFRNALYEYYGGSDKVATGWVSHTLFEPAVGNEILQKLADIPNLEISFNAQYKDIDKVDDKWVVSYLQEGQIYSVEATILIDATETGDLLPLVGADFRLGMDSKHDTGENEAPDSSNLIVQDLTYVVILQDIGSEKGSRGLAKKPKTYNKQDYACACKRAGGEMFGAIADCQQMINYAKLPNNKFMINWPNCGNDYYMNWPELTLEEQLRKIADAKSFTQGFVYYLQNELGFKNLRIAPEFPTDDYFPMIPYHREGRRLKGKVFLTSNHLERPYDFDLYRTGVAVGDYPIDHHHDKNLDAPEINFINIKVPSYNIPLGTIIPANTDNFLVAEKNISVSNIVNGTTRLQPVVLGIGQAAGTLAALSIKDKKKPAEISVRRVQNLLLKSDAYIMPYIDTKTDDGGFESMQRIGATGILRGFGVPYKWANQTWFYPTHTVSEYEWKEGLKFYYPELKDLPASGAAIKLEFIHAVVKKINPEYSEDQIENNWKSWDINQDYSADTPHNRRTVSILTDKILNPFEIEIKLNGEKLE
jgi:hypothetical protein